MNRNTPNDIIVENNVIKIIVNSKKYGEKHILVDIESYNKISKYRLCINKIYNTFYAIININKKQYKLHTLLTGYKLTDHINRDGLDNRLSNLRDASESDNRQNTINRRNTSGYKGVYKRTNGKWQASTGLHGKKIHIGTYNTKEEAAQEYNNKVSELYKEYALLNLVKKENK